MTPDTLRTVSPNKPKTPLRSFRIPDEKWERLRAKAAENGETATDVIIRAIDAYLDES